MENIETFFREINLFDFTSFFGLDFLKFSGPMWHDSWKNERFEIELNGQSPISGLNLIGQRLTRDGYIMSNVYLLNHGIISMH